MSDASPACRSHCPINFALETFGDKWTLLVVRDLMFKGKRTFGEFLASAEGIATNILADRLRRLERAGIVARTAGGGSRSRSSYRLTARGVDLVPIMLEITAWSAKHDPHSTAPPSFLRELESSRGEMIRQVRAALG